MLSGTPVVATDIPGARVVVKKTGMGEIVPAGDPAALGTALARVMKNRQAYVKSPSEINRVFGFEQTVDGYERLLRDAACRAGKS